MRGHSLLCALVGVGAFALICQSVWGACHVQLAPSSSLSLTGGQVGINPTYFCVQTNTTCPDPNYPATCGEQANLGAGCWQCKMIVVNWQNCGTTTNSSYTCTSSGGPNNPYCGGVAWGTPMNGSCNGVCQVQNNWYCGSQIPTWTGQNCP